MTMTEPTVQPSDLDKAYAAGILDGEGCIQICPNSRGKNGHYLRVEVVNTNARLLQWLKERFGGNVQARGQLDVRATKPLFVWSTASRVSAAFLRTVRPYLIVKATEADCGLLLQGLKRSTGGQELSAEQIAVEKFLAEQTKLAKR